MEPETLALAVDLYRSGLSISDVGRRVGSNPKTLRRIFVRHSVPLRSRQESWSLRRKHPFNESFFSTIDTEAKAYWLGFVSADGFVDDASRCLRVLLARRDKSHLLLMAKDFGLSESCVLDSQYHANGRCFHTAKVSFFSSRLVNDLIALGVVPRKSLILNPWDASPTLARHYWRGVFDGDGCISVGTRPDGQRWTVYVCGSPPMAKGFLDFVRSNLPVKGSLNSEGGISRASFDGVAVPQAVVRLLYEGSTISLDRKNQLVKELLAVVPKRPLGTHKDFSHIKAEDLTRLHAELGSWTAAANHIGLYFTDIHRLRRTVGLLPHRPKRRRA